MKSFVSWQQLAEYNPLPFTNIVFKMKHNPFSKSSVHFNICASTLSQKPATLLAEEHSTSRIRFFGQVLHPTALKALAMLRIVLFLPARSNAQLPCNEVDTDCVLSPLLPYKCITGTTSFQTQIDLGILVPADQSSNVVQRIVIKGNVTVSLNSPHVEYTFPTGSEIVFATSESRLTVLGGNTLRLIGVKVYGCHEEAYGIRVMENSTLIAEGCEFSDGALSVRPGSTISITGNTFRRSLYHMLIESGSGAVNFTAGGSISGNTFYGDEFLKPPYTGMKPLIGIDISSNITIGKSNGARNEFRNFGNGSGFEGNAIQGLGIGDAAPNTFQDCRTGVYIKNSNVDISNAKFTNIEEGVIHLQNSNAFPSNSVKIISCKFNGFLRKAVKSEGYPMLRLNAFEVQHCIFDDNAAFEGIKMGVLILSLKPSLGDKVKINSNKIYFRDRSMISSNFVLSGFYFSNLQKGRGENNEFYDEGAGGTITSAIRMEGCNGFVWSNNDVIGNNTVSTFGDRGFRVSESPNCVYTCNYLSGTKHGMWFEGLCNASNLYQNSFNDHNEYGLYLYSEGTVIGGQFKKYNTWSGINGDADAYLEFSNYDPFDIDDKNHVKKSLFTVQTSNQSTAFWADPRVVGNILGNDPNWFVGPMGPTPPTAYFCPPETLSDPGDPKLDYGEKGIVDGTFTPWKGYAGNTWDAAFLLYQRMTEDSTLRPTGSPEASWYASNYYGNLGKLRRIFDGFVSLTSDTPTFTATQLLSDLNAISTTTTHDQNLKTDLGIFLEQYIGNASVLTQQQTINLNAIADQCRYEGGIGVVLARLALGQSSTREGDCQEELGRGHGSNRSSHSSVTLNTAVFPNPVIEQAFSVQLNQSIQDGTLRLVDLQGRVVGVWTFSGDVKNILESNVTPGVYLLEVLEQGQILSRNKIVFSH